MAAKIRILQWESAVLDVDGAAIAIEVKRLDVDQGAHFNRLWERTMERESDRMVLVRRPGEEQERLASPSLTAERIAQLVAQAEALPEATDDIAVPYQTARRLLREVVQELQPGAAFVIADDEIRRRRIVEMTPDQRAYYEEVRRKDDASESEVFNLIISQYLRVKPGQIEIEIEGVVRDLTSGAELAAAFGSRPSILREATVIVRAMNKLTEAAKNELRSRFTSRFSSSERDREVTGNSSGPTAAPASPLASATTADATPIEATSSGATAPSA